MGPDEHVEIISVKSAPGMNWLSLVQFDLHPSPAQNETQHAMSDDLEDQMRERRKELLGRFNSMLLDAFSPLYTGFVTCKLDPTFSENFPSGDCFQSTHVYSSDAGILKIMNKYDSL